MVLTTYHNIPTDFISSWQWMEVNVKTLTNVPSLCHKAGSMGKLRLGAGKLNKTKKEKQKTKNTQEERETEKKEKKKKRKTERKNPKQEKRGRENKENFKRDILRANSETGDLQCQNILVQVMHHLAKQCDH